MFSKKNKMTQFIVCCAIILFMKFTIYGNELLSSYQPSPESDFTASINMEGTGVDISGYQGNDSVIYVPATIQGFPVKTVRIHVDHRVTTLIVSEGCEWVYVQRAIPYYDFPTNITRVYLPDSIEFYDLSNTKITEFEMPANPNVSGLLPETVTKATFRGTPPEILGSNSFRDTKITEIIIPEGVKEIKFNAFFGCEFLKTVVLPDSLTRIEDEVFAGCSSLESVKIPNNVTTIGVGAFEYCTALQSVNLPTSLQKLGGKVFANCINLVDLQIPESLSGFRMYDDFYNCPKLPFATQAQLRRMGYTSSF